MSSAAGAAGQPLDSGPPLASETAVAAPEQLAQPSPGRSHKGADQLRSFVLKPRAGGGHQDLVWIVIGAVVLAGVLAAVVTLVPHIRRLVSQKVRPHLVTIWTGLKAIATQPRKIVYVLAGSTASQLFIALCLGASLHAVGQHASLATLIVVLTLASIIGGAVPVPGGAGVIEVGLVGGLTAAGIPQSAAVAAALIERAVTAYLPLIWGWATLVWMRHREYI
jgi:uncharacterized membrane protein YbhN (UPF0104 family)